jgi:enoyl-CoA hydratase
MTYETLIVEKSAQVAEITINRPKVYNALNRQVLAELSKLLTELEQDETLRALVISGSGDKSFVAGADIAEMQNLSTEEALAFARLGQSVTERLEQAKFVTIAKVTGFALGGGCELAMACDVIVCTPESKFGQPEVNLGLIPGFGGTQRLVKMVGPGLANAMLLCGKQLNGEDAYKAGIAAYLASKEEIGATVDKILGNIRGAGPKAIAATKRLTRQADEIPLTTGLWAEASAFGNCFQTTESKEGLSAFIEKRKPQF